MGSAVCRAVAIDPDLELAAAVDPQATGSELSAGADGTALTIRGDLRAFADASCDVVVDFTVADAARVTLPWLAMHGVHAVVGTTGLDEADIEAVRRAFGDGPAHCVIAPNFAISAVLMMRFAEMAAPFFDSAEIVELHHDGKVDAPSGTAVQTAERLAAASSEWAADPTEREVFPGARGGLGPAGIQRPCGADAGDGRSPGSHPRHPRPDADDSPGQLRPRQLHAGCDPRVQANRRPPRPHHRPRQFSRNLSGRRSAFGGRAAHQTPSRGPQVIQRFWAAIPFGTRKDHPPRTDRAGVLGGHLFRHPQGRPPRRMRGRVRGWRGRRRSWVRGRSRGRARCGPRCRSRRRRRLPWRTGRPACRRRASLRSRCRSRSGTPTR